MNHEGTNDKRFVANTQAGMFFECPVCDGYGEIRFSVGGVSMNDPRQVEVEETCPHCGGDGVIQEGELDVNAERVIENFVEDYVKGGR